VHCEFRKNLPERNVLSPLRFATGWHRNDFRQYGDRDENPTQWTISGTATATVGQPLPAKPVSSSGGKSNSPCGVGIAVLGLLLTLVLGIREQPGHRTSAPRMEDQNREAKF
jgi:hypothetical protein